MNIAQAVRQEMHKVEEMQMRVRAQMGRNTFRIRETKPLTTTALMHAPTSSSIILLPVWEPSAKRSKETQQLVLSGMTLSITVK